jgi:uncharacterized protein (TIGR02145 family)
MYITKNILIFVFILSGMQILLMNSCTEENNTPIIPATPQKPVLSTTIVSDITKTSALCGGIISSDGGAKIAVRGVCWSTNQNPTISDSKTSDGTDTGSFTSNVTGLTDNTTYYICAYATNSAGTGYGNILSFKTTPNTITDFDGNIYHTVIIGKQVWLLENLNVTHYRNGDAIPNVQDTAIWHNQTTGAYCNYNNDISNGTTYGHLYNWFAVSDSRNIAPLGCHVPTDADWTTLTTFLGGELIAGGKLKENGTSHWQTPNTLATNEVGFTALPGGYLMVPAKFCEIGNFGDWWSASEATSGNAWARGMYYRGASVTNGSVNKIYGFSVRCMLD